MKAKLYLSKLHQDLIDNVRKVEQFKQLGDAAWTLCCDGFCCILDFSKFQDPRDWVQRKIQPKSWYLRKESFGALLWNPDTNRVFELDDEAYRVLLTLQEGTGLEKAVKEHGIKESDLHLLLAQIAEPGRPAKTAAKTAATKKGPRG